MITRTSKFTWYDMDFPENETENDRRNTFWAFGTIIVTTIIWLLIFAVSDSYYVWLAPPILGIVIALIIATCKAIEDTETVYEPEEESRFEIVALSNWREPSWRGKMSGTFLSVTWSASVRWKNVFRFVRQRNGYTTVEAIAWSGNEVRIYEDAPKWTWYVRSMSMKVPKHELERLKKAGRVAIDFEYSATDETYENWIEIHVPKDTVKREFGIEA